MKNSLQSFFSLLIVVFCFSSANAQTNTITITDTGPCVGTTLTRSGTLFNGKPFYTNGSAAISLYWDAGDARWEVDGSSATPGTNTFVVWVNSADTPKPPELAFGGWTDATVEIGGPFCGTLTQLSGDVSLPVEFLSFTGQPADKSVVLNWQTATETDSEKFEVEISRDGQRFQKIGEVAAEGTTTLQQDYSFLVNEPGAGTAYYRLKQMDLDGAFAYSGIISIDFNGSSESAGNFYPNPTTSGQVNISFASATTEELQVAVFDVTGKRVANQKRLVAEGGNALDFDFSGLNPGVYLVKLGNGATTATRKLIIK